VWQGLQESDMPPPAEDFAKWEAQFNHLNNANREDLDYGADFEEAYKKLYADENNGQLTGSVRFDESGVPQLGPYVFGSFISIVGFDA
jgi:peroxin-5